MSCVWQVPGDLLERLELLNASPFPLWAGHLVRYLLRLQPKTALAINTSMNAMHYLKPIVGCASASAAGHLHFAPLGFTFIACTIHYEYTTVRADLHCLHLYT